eukprot:gb/GEZN01001541.1/.p1 GENE.gb/GEZN01001541.1/~~gb/GEZN01001541.1/.p1  ORF type:complete len:856 (-),score=150.05 gb/GEZN01001541.1/:332-2899(-)
MAMLQDHKQASEEKVLAARRRQFQQEQFRYDRVPKPARLGAAVYFRAIQLFKRHDSLGQGNVPLHQIKAEVRQVFTQDFSKSIDDVCHVLEGIHSPSLHLLAFLDILASIESRDASERDAKSQAVRQAAEKMDRMAAGDLGSSLMNQGLTGPGANIGVASTAVAGQIQGFHELSCLERKVFDFLMWWRRVSRQRFVFPWWRRSFSQIEARHGASVVTYFFFAQSIFFLNILTALIFLVILIPGWKMFDWNGTPQDSYLGLLFGTPMAASWMFYGGYPAVWHFFRLDLVFVFVPMAMLFLSLALNLRYMGGDRDVFGAGDNTPFSALVLGGLDFTIKSKFSMQMQRRQRQRTMGILTEEAQEGNRYFQKHHNISKNFEGAVRYATGVGLSAIFGVLSSLCIAYIIVFEDKIRSYSLLHELSFLQSLSSLLTPLMVSFFKMLTPMVLVALVGFEHHPRALERFRATFLRLFLTRMAYVVVVLFQTLYLETKQKKGSVCNETLVGIIYWNLVMIDLILELILALVYPPIWLWLLRRAFCYNVSSYKYMSGSELGHPGEHPWALDADFQVLPQDKFKPEYNIPKELIDIMYRQALIWAGAPFCPLLPVLAVFHNFLLIYAKTLQVRWYTRPPLKPMGVDKQIRYFRGTMIVTLAICVIPFSLFLKRSVQCGPHMGSTPIDVFFAWLESGPAWVAFGLAYTRNTLLLWVLITLMGLYCLYLGRRHKVLLQELALLQRRVRMEVKDKTQIIRSNGILLDRDTERGKFMFRDFMARADMIKFAQRYGNRLHASYFDNLLELVKLSDAEIVELMSGWRVTGAAGPDGREQRGMTIPDEHIDFFLAKLKAMQTEFITAAATTKS